MKSIKSLGISLGIVSSIFLGACSNSNQTASPDNTSTSVSPASSAAPKMESSQSGESKKEGQVIEVGAYHLEFVPEQEDNGNHLDFYLQKGDTHAAVANAKVTAQVQLPDGTQKTLPLTYDTEGKHYTALLPEKTSGEYKVAILSDINGEKVNGRFTFKR